MRVVFDLETDGLDNPSLVWCVVARDVDTNEEYVFNVYNEGTDRLLDWAKHVDLWIGHNIISYDCPWISRLCGVVIDRSKVCDTLVLSHLLKYRLDDGHSLEAWGDRLGVQKVGLDIDFTTYSEEILNRCRRDVEINLKLYKFLMSKLDRKEFVEAIETEMEFAHICQEMHENGFAFDIDGARNLYKEIEDEVATLDKDILAAFPPKAKFIREYTPKLTKHGTISRTSVPRDWVDLTQLSDGSSFSLVVFEDFNPTSTKQIIERLAPFWGPVDRTDSYLDAVRSRDKERIKRLDATAWKVNEVNLSTLSNDAPPAAQLLVKRIMLGARVRTLTEWIENCQLRIELKDLQPGEGTVRKIRERFCCGKDTESPLTIITECLKSKNLLVKSVEEMTKNSWSIIVTPQKKYVASFVEAVTHVLDLWRQDGLLSTIISARVHGRFSGIGTWTHRMSHKSPNMGNIATAKSIKYNSKELKDKATELGGRMRSLWCAQGDAYLVGTDMESAHLRIFAHLINDEKFTEALLKGDKKLGTDPHSINASILRDGGRGLDADRDRSKTFIFTFLNGGGTGKVASIFGASPSRAKEALSKFIESYPGLKAFKEKDAKAWARRGYFIGPDGRFVVNDSDHHMLAGYLQNFEATMMKKANIIWRQKANELGIKFKQVNLVHDEYVTEVYGTEEDAWRLGHLQADAIRMVGELYGIRCPMGGETKVGKNWLEVH